MKNIFLISILLLSVVAFGNNEDKKIKTTSISGKVIDSNENLTGVKVVVDNKVQTVYTDFDGNFIIENIPVGVHTVTFSLVAYENKTVEVDLNSENTLEVKLQSR